MPVVAAGVHLARRARGIGQLGVLQDRQGIHVGAQADGGAGAAGVEQRDDAGPGHAGAHLVAMAAQEGGDEVGGGVLFVLEFGVAVQLLADGGGLGNRLAGEYGHR